MSARMRTGSLNIIWVRQNSPLHTDQAVCNQWRDNSTDRTVC